MNCTKCGKPVTDGSVFCNHCGEKLEQAGAETIAVVPSSDAPAPAEAAMRLDLPKILVISAVAVLFLALIFHGQLRQMLDNRAYNNIAEQMRKEAKAAGNPVGMFGLSWLMTMDDVKNRCRCAQTDPDTLTEGRELYGRQVTVRYEFRGGRLLQIVVAFPQGKIAPDNADADAASAFSAFSEVQKALSKDYGAMPEPVVGAGRDSFKSQKVMGRTTLMHQLSAHGDERLTRYVDEQIVMYKSG